MRKSIIIIVFFSLLANCTRETPKSPPGPSKTEILCNAEGVPDLIAIYTAEGVLIWDAAIELPTKNIAYDGIELHGENLCAAKLTYADGIHPAVDLPYELVGGKNMKIDLPWDRPRVDNSILMRTPRSFTRIKMSMLPIDETSRQILVHAVKAEVFK